MTVPQTLADLIRTRLAPLHAESLEVFDDSADHAGHAGAAESGGGHFQVFVVSEAFQGLSRVARHRLVYDPLRDLIPQRIHALAIIAQTPAEAAASGPAA